MNAKDIAAELWRGEYFRNSKRQYRLFEFLLENALSDAPRELDQYIIAVDVLERGEDFDPYSDSIVRSEISRLRKSLAIYSAVQAPYKFNIPKGRYNLEIEHKASASPLEIEMSNIAALTQDIPPRTGPCSMLMACSLLLGLCLLGLGRTGIFKQHLIRLICARNVRIHAPI